MGLTYNEKTAWLKLELPLFECTCDTDLRYRFPANFSWCLIIGSRYYELASRYYEFVSCYYELASRYYELVSHYYELTSR